MRKLSIIVAIMFALLLLMSQKANASEGDNTKTKIKIDFNKHIDNLKNYFSSAEAKAQEKTEEKTENQPADEEIPIVEESKPKIDPRDEILKKRWRIKQTDKWNNLPQGKFTVNASAYTAAADECGKSDGITSSGLKVQINRTIACPPNFPFGAKLSIEGYGIYVCEDRGGAIKGNKIDIYMETKAEAFKFGRRNLTAEVIL